MEALLLIGGIALLVWLAPKIREFRNPPPPPRPSPYSSPGQSRPKPSPDTYRPRPAQKPSIKFGTVSQGPAAPPDLEGLHDAFTGAPLNPALGLHQCTSCQVYYHTESLDVLREANAGQCVACGSTALVARGAQEARSHRGRDYDPNVITLANYRSHFGRVVTFEGMICELKVSKRGKDYALMFERASWTKGLKLVFFRRSIPQAGGLNFIKYLDGRHVRVRGLLIRHPIFGPEIVVSERSMILDVR